MSKAIVSLLCAAFLLAPLSASASFSQSVEIGRNQAAGLSQQQLDSLNARTFTDAFVFAKIVGFDRAEIDQLKADFAALQAENAQLRALLSSRPAVGSSVAPVPSNVEARMSSLEEQFNSLQGTLGMVVKMLTLVLAKLQ